MNREEANMRFAFGGLKKNGHSDIPAEEVIGRAIAKHGRRLTLGWSGGIDSTIALHIALQIDPKIKAVYVNTGIEFPENVEYVKEVTKLWDVNLTELRATDSFWDIVKQYGFPRFRSAGDGNASSKNTRSRRPYCCYLLKEKPRFAYEKADNINGNITGLRACESRVRAMHVGQRGLIYILQKPRKMDIYQPIALWDTPRIKQYLEDHEIPHNKTYDTQNRNGCWPCTGYKGWEKNMMRYNPEMYKAVQNMQGVMLMDDYIPGLVPCEDVQEV